MAEKIKAGVELSLKDGFSQKIKAAGTASKGFADTTLGAVNKIDGALSGTAAKLAAFGVTLSLGTAAKEIIQLDHRMARLGLTAGSGAEQIAALKRGIFEAARLPEIKLDPTEIVSALEVIMTKTGDLQFAEDNIRNVALAIQASGEAGAPMGDVFSEFAKAGYTALEITGLLNDMVAQSDKGEFTFAEFAKNAKGVISAYSVIGNSPEDLKRANAAMQILTAGTKSSEVATTVLNSAINELTDPEKRKKLEKLGITVRDSATGKLRDFNDIMSELAAASKDMEKADYINGIFGSESIKAIRAYGSDFAKILPGLLELGDTAGKIEEKSATMAGTLQSNLVNLQTAFINFADSNLGGLLETVTAGLNKLAEDPKRVEAVFKAVARGITAIALIKGIAGVSRLVGSLAQLQGGKVNITESLSMASAMPVYVTNWGGAAVPGTALGLPQAGTRPGGTLLDQYGNPIATQSAAQPKVPAARGKPQPLANAANAVKSVSAPVYALGAASGGILAAVTEVPAMFNELETIKNNTGLTDAERGRAKGGAIGDAAGSILGGVAGGLAGVAANAAIGAALGSVVPGLGTVAGMLAGLGVGALGIWLGGKTGRAAGEEIGEAGADGNKKPSGNTYYYGGVPFSYPAQAGGNESGGKIPAENTYYYGGVPVSYLPPQIAAYKPYAPPQQGVRIDGSVGLKTDLYIHNDGTFRVAQETRNNTEIPFETGRASYARGWQ
jgi:hypothetical protein